MRSLAATGTVFVALLLALTACSASTSGAGRLPSSAHTTGQSAPTQPPPSSPAVSTPASSARPASSTPSTKTIPAPTAPLRTVQVQGTDGTSTYLVDIWVDVSDQSCAHHAYGAPVIDYLTKHPCDGLRRMLATTTVDGHAVGMAVSDVIFRGTAPTVYQTAGNFVGLVTKNGTGNISDLLREGYRLPAGPTAVPSPDAFSAEGQDAGCQIVDAWYLDGPTPDNDPPLVTMAKSLFLQLGN